MTSVEQLSVNGRYALTKSDFSQERAPQTVAPWNFPEPVTRENFLAFVIKSYAVSRGAPKAQAFYIHFVGDRIGLDTRQTMKAFGDAGGWLALTSSERSFFLETWHAVSAHGEEYGPGFDVKDIDDEIKSDIEDKVVGYYRLYREGLLRWDVTKMTDEEVWSHIRLLRSKK